jgi:hypothetical protein
MTHFTLKHIEKIIRKKNIQNGSNKSDSIMTPKQMKTVVRAISQNIMNTKYNQIIVNTKCKTILLLCHTVCVNHLYLNSRKTCSMFTSISQWHTLYNSFTSWTVQHKTFWSPVQTSLLNILTFLPKKLEFDTQVLWDMTPHKMVNNGVSKVPAVSILKVRTVH